ncbi:hypothetical protein FPSE_04921 [Fusarium pseudograminearum CS3096]|uniref:Uncharacterized protein n=1 Tax=Fusarium pseudograminearum (strain CS3096) TaxID=1028729 RepID=K3W0X0_FUSPC|nr:hypothetical protein FPSE_04921 [Fusarium pseudograminearum CS3096]EKJ74885.1 hypothetical protein FPSE_04921 [Fusarium pseudograminearum CS3096]
MASTTESDVPWFLKSSYPVLFPFDDAVRKPQAEFDEYLRHVITQRRDDAATTEVSPDQAMTDADQSETFTLVSNSTSAEIRQGVEAMDVSGETAPDSKPAETIPAESHPFMEGLINYQKEEPSETLQGMMLTENGDLAYRYTESALVDLFQELEEVVSGPRLNELLLAAWRENPIATLRIIFNARSIHLGKSSRITLYRCAGWLAQNHPMTLIANLRWLSRPVIEKKAEKKEDDDLVIVEDENKDETTKFDIRNGVAHGYWKDLLNILALAVNKKLAVLEDPKDILNSENPGIIRGKSVAKPSGRRGARGSRGRGGVLSGRINTTSQVEDKKENARPDPKEVRREARTTRYETATAMFKNDPVYRALHLSVARLFAKQLDKDLRALRGDDKKAKRSISFAGKWAPSHDHFHDRHTFVVSTIAEIMYPRESINNENLKPTDDHETYLRFAREEYRKDTSALRKHLEIVERAITENRYGDIKYDRVPSLAMNQYSKLFIEKDAERFDQYLDKVAEGKANISGATLLPSTLIHKVRQGTRSASRLDQKIAQIESKVLDGQWNALVQRIKDSGTMDSSIAVCDVSGSMDSPTFSDKTTPMDSAIGLSLLVAEVAKPPFAGAFITFSSHPSVENVDLSKTLAEKINIMDSSEWGMSTNFVSVFEDLILPMATKNNLKNEDMVKRVFVFSDMQFNDACDSSDSIYSAPSWSNAPKSGDEAEGGWDTSYERIKAKFEVAGYEMPELVFWNLAGGRAGYGQTSGDPVAPKPVKSDENGTCLVSGYSQGLLKVFLDGGGFEEEQEEEEVVVEKDSEGNVTQKVKKVKISPLKIVQKAISHKAYEMLTVVD